MPPLGTLQCVKGGSEVCENKAHCPKSGTGMRSARLEQALIDIVFGEGALHEETELYCTCKPILYRTILGVRCVHWLTCITAYPATHLTNTGMHTHNRAVIRGIYSVSTW